VIVVCVVRVKLYGEGFGGSRGQLMFFFVLGSLPDNYKSFCNDLYYLWVWLI